MTVCGRKNVWPGMKDDGRAGTVTVANSVTGHVCVNSNQELKELQPEQRKVIDFEKCLYYNLQVGY